MKVGEKKTVTIPPEDGYGTDTWIPRGEQTVDIKIFDAILERTVLVTETKDIIKMEVDKKVLEKDGELPKV